MAIEGVVKSGAEGTAGTTGGVSNTPLARSTFVTIAKSGVARSACKRGYSLIQVSPVIVVVGDV